MIYITIIYTVLLISAIILHWKKRLREAWLGYATGLTAPLILSMAIIFNNNQNEHFFTIIQYILFGFSILGLLISMVMKINYEKKHPKPIIKTSRDILEDISQAIQNSSGLQIKTPEITSVKVLDLDISTCNVDMIEPEINTMLKRISDEGKKVVSVKYFNMPDIIIFECAEEV